MFLKHNPRNGHHFLILMRCAEDNALPMRGLVRRTTLHQCGHFMMGHVTITGKTAEGPWKHRIPLSGAYGADGLTRDVPRVVYDKGTVVPAELVEAWNKGGGHNSAGSEAPAMLAWGLTLMRKEAEAKARKPRPPAKGRMRASEASSFYHGTIRDGMLSHFRRAVAEQWTWGEMHKHWHSHVLGHSQWHRTPGWVHERTIGARDAFMAMLYTHFLEWRVWIRDVGLVAPADMKVGKYQYSDCIADKGQHCWKDTGKVWSDHTPPNGALEAEVKEASNG